MTKEWLGRVGGATAAAVVVVIARLGPDAMTLAHARTHAPGPASNVWCRFAIGRIRIRISMMR